MNADALSSNAFIISQTKEKWSGNVISGHRGKCEACGEWMLKDTALLLHSIFSVNRDGIAITQFQKQVEKNDRAENGSVGKTIVFLCFHFYFRGCKSLFGVLSPSSSPWRRDRCFKPSQASGSPGSLGFAGHFATGFKWLSSQLI